MKKKLPIILIAILWLSSCRDRSDDIIPTESNPNFFTFNGQIGTNDHSTIVSYDNNLLICGNSGDSILVLKISKSGDEIWRNVFLAENFNKARSITEVPGGDIFVCGSTYSNHEGYNILLCRLKANGDTVFTKTYGGIEDDYGYQIISSSDGHLVLSCATNSYGAQSFPDIYLMKLNQEGNTLWAKRYDDPDQERSYSLLETSDGGFLVTGTNEDNSSYRGLYLLRVSPEGEKLWDKTIGLGEWKWGFSTIELSGGDFMTCGRYTYGGRGQVLVIKTDSQGNEIWEKEFGDENLSEEGRSVKQNNDGTFMITGSSYDINTMQDDIILLKIDQAGNQMWIKYFGGPEKDWGMNLIKDANDDNIITGDYSENIFMARTDKDGNFK